MLPVEKAALLDTWTEHGVCSVKQIDNGSSCWCFSADTVPWSRGLTPLSSTATRITSLSCLCKEGAYWASCNKWKRVYITRSGIEIILTEDVPESGGQNCLWCAGVVMARYIENPLISTAIQGKRVLELGAGAGLTSMVASIIGGDVYGTEQDSCINYLEYNLALNPHIPPVTARTLHWMNDYSGSLFDVIIGCDITYDINMTESIFATLKLCLDRNGVCLICHDDDSCPMSPEAHSKLLRLAGENSFDVEDITYTDFVEPCFCGPKIKMWKIVHTKK